MLNRPCQIKSFELAAVLVAMPELICPLFTLFSFPASVSHPTLNPVQEVDLHVPSCNHLTPFYSMLTSFKLCEVIKRWTIGTTALHWPSGAEPRCRPCCCLVNRPAVRLFLGCSVYGVWPSESPYAIPWTAKTGGKLKCASKFKPMCFRKI